MSENLRHWLTKRFLPQQLDIRDPKTKAHYQRAVNDFAELLGREPELSDLTDENLTALITHLLDARKLAEVTANERAGRLRRFWDWCARKRKQTGVEEFPAFGLAPEPQRTPIAWRENELVKLFNACRMQRGDYDGVPAWRWWTTLHAFLWNTGERIGATLAMRVEHLRLEERVAVLPAEIRKGKREPRVHVLWADVVVMLEQILPPNAPHRELVFPWPKHHTTMYYHYGKLLRSAGLPSDRYCKPQRFRVSHASWSEIVGDDPCKRLGHKDPATTRRSYIDPSLAKQDESKLFRPW